MPGRFVLLFVSLAIMDVYAFLALHTAIGSSSWLYIIYFGISLFAFGALTLFFSGNLAVRINIPRRHLVSLIFGIFLPKCILSVFLLVEDIARLIKYGITKIASGMLHYETLHPGLERSAVWSWVAITFTAVMALALIYGALFNVYNYQLRNIPLALAQLPAAFRGFKVVQISDIHSGSLSRKASIQKAVDTINKLDPDLVFFTGDLVNNIAAEALPFIDVLGGIQSKYGVYSVLGNHDYGDYIQWDSAEDKVRNFMQIRALHSQLGWRLLLNEHVQIESGNAAITIAGVENWSASSRFPKHGKLQHALSGIDASQTILLLSHDPSHWEAEVLQHPAKIDVMFAGHTHGMQFGIELGNFKWSPVQYFYKQWAGLYESSGRYLYVNRGFGVLGYRGRIGILPEITLFTLQTK